MSADGYLRRWQVFATLAIAALAVAATLLGLFRAGFYRDPYALRLQAYGQDAVTLGVVVPLLLAGLWLATRGSLRGYLLWLGALAYLLYTYAVYAVITEFNPFFLGYVALFGLSLYTFVAGLVAVDAAAVKRRLAADLPVRLVAGFLAGMGGLVALLWLSEALPATLANRKPASIAAVGLPANVVHVLDLGVVVPATLLAAWWLRERRPWGYVLPGVLLVKVVSIGLAVLAMLAIQWTAGEPVAAAEVAVFGVVTLAGVAVGLAYFRSIRPGRPDDADRRAVATGD